MKIYLDNNLGVTNVEQEELTQDTIGYNILKVYIPNAVLTPYDTFTCYYGALLQNGRKVGWFAMEARTDSDADYEANYTLYKATLEQCVVSVEGKVYIGCQVLLGNSGNATLIKKNTAVVQFNVRKSVAINNDILVLDPDQTTTDVLESYKNLLENALLTYATKAEVYTKAQMDALLLQKADKSDTYTKQESDNKFALKSTAVTHDGNQLKDNNGNNIYPNINEDSIPDNSIDITKTMFSSMLYGSGSIEEFNYQKIGLGSSAKNYNNNYRTLDNIYIGTIFDITITIPNGYKLAISTNDANESNYNRVYNYTSPENNTYTFTSIANKYYSFSLSKVDGTAFNDNVDVYYINISVNRKLDGNLIKDYSISFSALILEHTSNLFNKNDVVSGYLDTYTNILSSTTYSTSNYIKVTSGVPIYIPKLRKFAFYNNNKVGVEFISNTQTDYIYTPNQNGYIRFSFWVSDIDTMFVTENTTTPVFEQYGYYLPDDVYLNPSIIDNIENNILSKETKSVLDNKKWYAYGDSFTEGDFNGIADETLYKFQEGRYVGYKKVYPYWIGNRTKCNVINNAHSGDTLANEFVGDEIYKTIPNDADIITLYYGINDSHQNIPIGNIDDNTNETFYGAWNIAIEWLLTNRPNAKIGIIISNGCDTTAYPTATINICKKWGLSYLDINGDTTLPMVIRANMRDGLSQASYNYWLQKYAVNYGTNNHPNVKAHENESYMIQQWLERL